MPANWMLSPLLPMKQLGLKIFSHLTTVPQLISRRAKSQTLVNLRPSAYLHSSFSALKPLEQSSNFQPRAHCLPPCSYPLLTHSPAQQHAELAAVAQVWRAPRPPWPYLLPEVSNAPSQLRQANFCVSFKIRRFLINSWDIWPPNWALWHYSLLPLGGLYP